MQGEIQPDPPRQGTAGLNQKMFTKEPNSQDNDSIVRSESNSKEDSRS